jgi:hypothetical protein
MIEDVVNNHHLYVFDGGEDHPILSRKQNWKFRAIHDVFGHAMNYYQFGPNGEERAWNCHKRMFTPTARQALTTETRGQNSWVNFGPYSYLPVKDRPFAKQKGILLPEFCW